MTHDNALELLRLASVMRRRAERLGNFDMAVRSQTAQRRIQEWLWTHREQAK